MGHEKPAGHVCAAVDPAGQCMPGAQALHPVESITRALLARPASQSSHGLAALLHVLAAHPQRPGSQPRLRMVRVVTVDVLPSCTKTYPSVLEMS